MIKIVKPITPYVPEIGDVDIYGKHHEYMEAINWDLFRTMNPMPIIGFFSANPWISLQKAGIDHNDVEKLKDWSKNHCLCSDMDYYAIVPIAILTSDATRYTGEKSNRNTWGYDILNDAEWNRYQGWGFSNEGEDDLDTIRSRRHPDQHLGSVVRAMLGSGYNYSILPHDGGHNFIITAIPLDNNDKVIIIGWEWYNK